MNEAKQPNTTPSNPSVERFVSTVLAPIPEGSEQADTLENQKLLQADLMRAWKKGMKSVKAIKDARSIECKKNWESQEALVLWRQLIEAENRQCLIPAPTAKELRWKKKTTHFRDTPQNVKDAVEMDEKRLSTAFTSAPASRKPSPSDKPLISGNEALAMSATVDRLKQIAADSGDRLFLSDGPPHPDFELLDVCGDLLHTMNRRKALLAESRVMFPDNFERLPRIKQNEIRVQAHQRAQESFDLDGPISSLLNRARKLPATTSAGVYAKVLVIRASETGAGRLAQTLADDLINVPSLRDSIWPDERSKGAGHL